MGSCARSGAVPLPLVTGGVSEGAPEPDPRTCASAVPASAAASAAATVIGVVIARALVPVAMSTSSLSLTEVPSAPCPAAPARSEAGAHRDLGRLERLGFRVSVRSVERTLQGFGLFRRALREGAGLSDEHLDAREGGSPGEVVTRSVARELGAAALTHSSSPEVMALADRLHGARPPAALVTVTGRDFGLGEGLSPEVAASLPALRAAALAFLRGAVTTPSSTRG
jgi:hypothetical protein